LTTPSLRYTGQDILHIANHYLQTHAKHYGKKNLHFTPDAEQLLLRYSWPGNVRELRNMLEQSVLLAQTESIDASQLNICPGLLDEDVYVASKEIQNTYMSATPTLKKSEIDKQLVQKTLEKTDWNVSKSAKLLGLTRDMMRYRIEKYGLISNQN
jgi:DNA-binding NtrC family response regulator